MNIEKPMIINNIVYYYTQPNIFFWEGITTTDNNEIFILSGTNTDGFGALYFGPLEMLASYPIYSVKFPNSATTNAYGTHYLTQITTGYDLIRIVGSYQFQKSVDDLTLAYVFTGTINELNNSEKYTQIKSFKPSKFTVAHSTSNILAVYVTSDISPISAGVGESYIYDIEKAITLTQIIFPGSISTTVYGICYNGESGGFQSYTFTGGYSFTIGASFSESFIADFLYNVNTGEYYFTNWSKIKIYTDDRTISHIQGITKVSNNIYKCCCANEFIQADNSLQIFESMSITLERIKNNGFKIIDTLIYNIPLGKISILTSITPNNVVGAYIDNNGALIPFQASNA